MTDTTTKTWVPRAWCDEVTPSGLLKSPNQYLEFQPDRTWRLCFPEGHYECENENYQMTVEHGQIIEWISNEYLGLRTLTIRNDGTYELCSPFPSHATIFWLPEEWECIGDTIEELVAVIKEQNDQESGEYSIAAAWWSEVFSKRLEAQANQPVRFVDCAGTS